jgi:predicted ATPase
MTLNFVEVENFKCFRKLRLGLAPLTLFTGFNTAGKTTVLQAILLIAQALQIDRGLKTVPLNGPLIRLGLPGDVVSANISGRSIKIGLETDTERAVWVLEPQEPGLGLLRVASAEHRVETQQPRTWKEAIWSGSPENSTSIESTLLRTIYLSAIRMGGSAAFQAIDHAGRVPADMGVEGQYAPWWYARTADDEVVLARRHPAEKASSVRRQLDAYLSELFPNAQANAEQIARTSLVRLEFKTSTTSDWRRPANVGYGLSYAFPILLALLVAQPGQIIVIDSPEAHLHPRAQSLMGRMLARFAASGIQLLVETHSDHVLNGARLAVRESDIGAENIAVHFFSGTTDTSHGVISVRLDKDGAIDAWPTGFFDQSEQDLARLAGWE